VTGQSRYQEKGGTEWGARQMSIMRRLISIIAKRKAQEVEHLLNNQLELMDNKLMSILRRHRDTVYGRRFGFDARKMAPAYL
jgi:hypothetical protein